MELVALRRSYRTPDKVGMSRRFEAIRDEISFAVMTKEWDVGPNPKTYGAVADIG